MTSFYVISFILYKCMLLLHLCIWFNPTSLPFTLLLFRNNYSLLTIIPWLAYCGCCDCLIDTRAAPFPTASPFLYYSPATLVTRLLQYYAHIQFNHAAPHCICTLQKVWMGNELLVEQRRCGMPAWCLVFLKSILLVKLHQSKHSFFL